MSDKEQTSAKVKKYVATVGLNLDGVKDKPRIEAGESIPALPDKLIKQLLADGDIEEA